ncbi:hypothetical protein KKI95_19535 [Xenorhabdus bovienii]|uniref:hypothetical protein n=1 Tax=Xenorhabdus bovienii TaxID=40576 RepID=UPI0023B308F6|nr:hypothetical protein [Xenorhabdus bovienii]MDE9430565.1 hypothetical protein [Xenorhabdus bovienii]MDE9438030.1 hypothetical protein [Xenorhabdus bovienii]MDE9456017.1 hypothetical protein [Xenorhabdus bovienii]MDE9499852.1 hypothetical protein [Xenorhabdus bovienii]
MLFSIYKYKVESFFNEKMPPLDDQFLCYRTHDEDQINNENLFFKKEYNGEYLQVRFWEYLFREYIPEEYWNHIPDEFIKNIGIPGFVHMDYSGVNLILNNMFFIFDIHREVPFYRKELTKFYCQYQLSHYEGDNNIRLFFLKRLFGEMWIWNLAYDKLSIKNGDLIFKSESGADYNIHELIDRLCDIIRVFSLPDHLLDMLDFINPMLHECIDIILGKNGVYDFNFDDVNLKYIDGSYFLENYRNNQEEIFNAIKGCVRDCQSFQELFVSHVIVMNYSCFILKNSPDEILQLKSFLSDSEETFIKLLSLAIDINFYVWEDSFDGLNLEEHLEKVEKSDFLIDK